MAAVIGNMYVMSMQRGLRVIASDGPSTRLGQLGLAGEVIDDEPRVGRALRVNEGYVLSVLISGRGTYRDGARAEAPIAGGAVTTVRPGVWHWYGTAPGERWTEIFAVFSGPLFDTLAAGGVIPATGPRRPRPLPSAEALRAVLQAKPASMAAAERQLLALADWLAEANPPAPDTGRSAPIVAASAMLAEDLGAPVDLRAVAAAVGLPYDTFRRRFAAEVGQAPLSFRSDRRLQTAATLLRMTELTTRTIARTLGYADEFHFSRRFRARFGMPPRDYRRRSADRPAGS
jgi:AraC-like DNA-binding protein